MKKVIACILCVLMFGGMLSGCSTVEDQKVNMDGGKKIRVVCSIFPEYDWTREIIGDAKDYVELSMLLDSGVDLHSYQPTADDMIDISTCDVFIYVGGESDAWVKDTLKEATNSNMIVINLLDVLGETVKEEKIVEGMEEEKEEEGHKDNQDVPEYDEHVWLSLKNAKVLCNYIAEQLGKADPDHTANYTTNAAKYCEQLTKLDEKYENMVKKSDKKTVLFGDRFPFRYMADDYNLEYFAAFPGCSAETEASFKTITFLAGKVDELKLGSVLTIEGAQHKIAKTIIDNTDKKKQKVLTMDSMQSISEKDVQAGETYLSIMEKNLKVLKEALQ